MSDVIEIRDLYFDGDRLVVEAVVDGVVLTRQQSELDPPEWGPALCRGSFDLHEEDLIPASDDGLRQLLTNRIDDWAPIDTSDWDD